MYEYLDLYLVPEVNSEAKRVNANAMKKALAIRSKRILHPETIGEGKESKGKKDCAYPDIRTLDQWLDRYEMLMFGEGVSSSIMKTVARTNQIIRLYLDHIKRPKFLISKIDKSFAIGLLAWLRTDYKSARSTRNESGLSAASLRQYQTRFSCVFNRAVREGLMKSNPIYSLDKTQTYSVPAANREYLTKDELERFLAVETQGKAVQQAFGFASFTGLRKSDIRALTWGNILKDGDKTYIVLRMAKTKEQVMVPLGRMAQQYLPIKPEGAEPSDKVFNLPTDTAIQTDCKWIAAHAGIQKNVSFHTSRHTFATLTLAASHDIKLVSRLLGHQSVTTTQVYAEVLPEIKMHAMTALANQFKT